MPKGIRHGGHEVSKSLSRGITADDSVDSEWSLALTSCKKNNASSKSL